MKFKSTSAHAAHAARIAVGPQVAAFALAVVAIGGVGAAVTSAAWTDNTFFAAQAEAATFNLQGSLDGTTWAESDDVNSVQLVVPATHFANLLPGESRDVTLHVRNLGSVSAALTASADFTTGSTFVTAPALKLDGLNPTLSAQGITGNSDTFVLTVTTPADWDGANQGKSGTVLITIGGTATA